MSWGNRPGGGTFGPVQDVEAIGIEKGLSEGWYSGTAAGESRDQREIHKGNFWDVIDNPLYEVAAEAKGYDWDEWIKEAKGLVGKGPNDGTIRVRAMVDPGTPDGSRGISGGPNRGIQYVTTPGRPPTYEWMTKDEAKEGGYEYDLPETTRWRNKNTGKIVTDIDLPRPVQEDQGPVGASGYASLYGQQPNDDWKDDWEEVRDWGVYDEGVAEDLDEIRGWLKDIVSVNDHLGDIIREGPKGEWYGLPPGTDIWEHYGLDKDPEPPKELDWDSYEKSDDFVLKEIVKSTVTYSTPEGITPVDLHSE